MKSPDQTPTTADIVYEALSGPLRDEVKALLKAQDDLAHQEKNALLREKTRHVAHKIRNSLSTIQALCGSLMLEVEDSEKEERLRLISSQVEQMGRILSDAIDSESEPDNRPEPVVFEELAASLAKLLHFHNQEDLKMTIDVEPELTGCLPVAELRVCLYRLLRRAADALEDHPGGEIQLRCRSHNAEWLELTVCNNASDLSPLFPIHDNNSSSRWLSEMEWLHVERFATRLGGRLERETGQPGECLVTLHLPRNVLDPAA